MPLGEVSNNFFGWFFQYYSMYTDRFSTNYDFAGGLGGSSSRGLIDESETIPNKERIEGKTFHDLDFSKQLYVLLNLFESLDSEKTLRELNKWYRRYCDAHDYKNTINNQDAFVRMIAEQYGYNVIPYFEAWGIKVSSETKEMIFDNDYKLLGVLGDMVTDEGLTTNIKVDEGLAGDYSLVSNDLLNKFQLTGKLQIDIKIDGFNQIKDKYLYLLDGDRLVKKVKVENPIIELENMPLGTYKLQMPIPNEMSNYKYDYDYVIVSQGESKKEYEYTTLSAPDYNNSMWLGIKGIYNTYGFKLELTESNKAKITLGAANLGNQNSTWESQPDKIYTSVTIYDNQNNEVYKKEVKGREYFSASGAIVTDIDIDSRYIVEVYHVNPRNHVKVFSTLDGEELSDYSTTEVTTRYIVTDYGFRKETMSEEEGVNASYQRLKSYLTRKIDEYQENVTEEELENKHKNIGVKQEILMAIEMLRTEDQVKYKTLYDRIKRGGIPKLVEIKEFSFTVGAEIDLYSLIEVKDNEDGILTLTSENTQITTDLDVNIPGSYVVNYVIFDSDKNRLDLSIQITVLEQPEQPGEPEQSENPGQPGEPEQPELPEQPDVKPQPSKPITGYTNIMGYLGSLLLVSGGLLTFRKKK